MQPLQLLEMKRQLQCKLPVPCLHGARVDKRSKPCAPNRPARCSFRAGRVTVRPGCNAQGLRNDSSVSPMSTSEFKLWMVWCKRSQSFLSGGGRRRSREPQMDTVCANLFKSEEALPFGRGSNMRVKIAPSQCNVEHAFTNIVTMKAKPGLKVVVKETCFCSLR